MTPVSESPAATPPAAPAEPAPEIVVRVARRRRLRVVLLVAIVASLIVLARVTGLSQRLDAHALQAEVRAAGPWGVAVFFGAFIVGVLVHVPGTFFVAAGVLVYGQIAGYFLSLGAATLAVWTSFIVTRAIGGQPLGEARRPVFRRMLARLDERPLLWVFVLRNMAFISPPLNTALALTKVRFRDYAIGSALGLVLPMALWAFALDWLVNSPWFGRLARLIGG